jgi:hypothetical protein
MSPATRDRMERALDAALELTFPASDPTAVYLGDSPSSPVSRRDSDGDGRAEFQETP